MVHEPVVVVHTFIFGAFKWIGAQIFDQGIFLFLSSPITNKTLWLSPSLPGKRRRTVRSPHVASSVSFSYSPT